MRERHKYLIDHVIAEEGGWQLTDHPDDPDICTYGGMRYKTYLTGATELDYEILNVEAFKRLAREDSILLQEYIRNIYEYRFLVRPKLSSIASNSLLRPVLSCAVNCGITVAIKTLQESHNKLMLKQDCLKVDGVFGPISQAKIKQLTEYDTDHYELVNTFCFQWQKFYVDLVQANAEAWRQHTKYLENEIGKANLERRMVGIFKQGPSILRATFLEGWLNRVNKYRIYA